jgi:hypothetical protein
MKSLQEVANAEVNSKANSVLIEVDDEGPYVKCPWLDSEKISVDGECEFSEQKFCPKFLGKSSEGDHVLCGYRLT